MVVKFSEMPSEVTTDKNGWKHFVLDCGGKLLRVGMRPKNWTKVEKAVVDWPQWVAALGGQLQVDAEGLSLPEANVQVFERKSKPVEGSSPEKDPPQAGGLLVLVEVPWISISPDDQPVFCPLS